MGRMAANAREAAFMALSAWRARGSWQDARFKASLSHLPRAERSLATHIAYGVVSRALTLDGYIRHASSIGLSRVEPAALDILRIGVYQILFLTKIPKSAAVDQSVNLARVYARRAVSYINAVLRAVSAWETPPELDGLWRRKGHPEWLADRLVRQEGPDRAAALMDFNNSAAPLCLNPKPGVDLAGMLARAGIDARRHPLGCLLVERAGAVEELPGYAEGDFLVADAAARAAVLAAAPKPGEAVLDACAAPGGKTVLMNWIAGGGLTVTACDLHERRVRDLQVTLAKYGMDGVKCMERDASVFHADFAGAFDLVFADVPCSGFGVIRKKPDIRYKKELEVAGLPLVQEAILNNLALYVKPGGRLVYVTCTVLREENGDVVERFLKRHTEFGLEPFAPPPGVLPGDTAGGTFAVWPPEHDMDGFYMARMRKER